MNNYTGAIGSFIRFDVVVFNTLEYAMKKDKYDVNAYKARKEIINNEITQNKNKFNSIKENICVK